MSRIARICAYTATLTIIAGCTMGELWAEPTNPVNLTPTELTGTWRSGSDQEITFAANGTFTATDLPREAFPDLDFSEKQLDGSGTWQLAASVVALTYQHLDNTEAERTSPNLTARREGDTTWLYFFYGLEGSSWTAYRR